MLTCKQVSRALAREDYENLPPLRKFFLKLHVRFCVICGRFNRQVMETQDLCRHYKAKEEGDFERRPKLDASKKEELRSLLAAHGQDR